MADKSHTQMLMQTPAVPSQQQQMEQSQIQQLQMQQQQSQQPAVDETMSLGSTVEQTNHMNITTSVPINIAIEDVSQSQQMQTTQQNVSTSSGTPVQVAVSQLTAQAQTAPLVNMISQNSGPHPAIMHPTMTMAQSPLQQVQVIQQPLPPSYLHHLYAPQQQMLFPGNLTLQHTGMTTSALQSLVAAQGLSLQLQAKPTLDSKTSVRGQTVQSLIAANKNMTGNPEAMMAASGQVIGIAASKSNFPHQMMTAPGKSNIIHSQSGFAPSNTVVISQLVPNQQSIFNHTSLAESQKGKTYTFHNQPAAIQPKYSPSIPVHTSTQVFNGSYFKQIATQPQIISTQTPAMFNQAQILGSLQTLGAPLSQRILWATPGSLQSSALTQNPIIIGNQHSDMILQPPPQTTMQLPITAPVPPIAFAATPLAPQKHKQVRRDTQTVAVATQTAVSSALTVNSNATPIHSQIKTKVCAATGSSPGVSPSPATPQMATTQASQCHYVPEPQSGMEYIKHVGIEQQKSDAANQPIPNLVKAKTFKIKSTETQCISSKVETKQHSSTQLPAKSLAMVSPSTKIVQSTIASTIGITVATVTSSTVTNSPIVTTSTVQVESTVKTVMSIVPISISPSLSNKLLENTVNTNVMETRSLSVAEESKEHVASQSPEPMELDESKHAKSQPVVKSSLLQVKVKQPQTAVVKPQVLTHVIDGFVIQEGPEPFPVNRPYLFSDISLRKMPSEKLKNSDKSKTAAISKEKTKIYRPCGNVELAKCEFCGEMGPKSKFKLSKRFCSTSCAKSYNTCYSKSVGHPTSATEENGASGPGRKRKASCRGRRGRSKQSLNKNQEIDVVQLEDDPLLKNESESSVKVVEGNPVLPAPPLSHMRKDKEIDIIPINLNISRKLPNEWTVSRSSLLSETSIGVMPSENLKKMEDFTTAVSPEKKMKNHRTRGPGRKKKAGFRGRKGLRNRSLNKNQEIDVIQFEDDPTSKDESESCIKAIEKNSVSPALSYMQRDEKINVINESNISQKLPNQWTVQEVFEFIHDLPGCSDYADAFKSQEIDGQALLLLKADILMTAMCMKVGPALKLISHINSIKEELSLS